MAKKKTGTYLLTYFILVPMQYGYTILCIPPGSKGNPKVFRTKIRTQVRYKPSSRARMLKKELMKTTALRNGGASPLWWKQMSASSWQSVKSASVRLLLVVLWDIIFLSMVISDSIHQHYLSNKSKVFCSFFFETFGARPKGHKLEVGVQRTLNF